MMRGGFAALVLFALGARAEESSFNLHVDPGVGPSLNHTNWVSGAHLSLDTTGFELGPIAPEIEIYGLSANNSEILDQGAAFGGGVGARLRLFNDEKGYLFNPGGPNGNLLGNLWVAAHLNYSNAPTGIGFDVGVGYEFSLIDGLQVGPFGKLLWLGNNQMLLFGLTFSVGFPTAGMAPEGDPDGDGVKGPLDKCPEVKGPPENASDGDGVVDRLDKCPNVAGPKENKGCPDTDQDGDGVIDRLDKCKDKPGTVENNGCPLKEPSRDSDGDGVPDEEDKCKDVPGPKENGGCPVEPGTAVPPPPRS